MRRFVSYLSMILIAGACVPAAHCQDSLFSHQAYLEFGGSGGAFSFNYEQNLIKNPEWMLRWSAGLTAFPIDKNNGIVFVLPTHLHFLVGQTAHKAEIGVGHALSVTTKGSGFSMFTPCIGYRYEHPQKSWFYRLTYTPLVSYLFQFQYQNWVGLSVGYQW